MSKDWDDLGIGQAMQASHEAWLKEAIRVLKPGGRIHAFSGTRTHHRLGAAMEALGLGVGWSRNWIHGQGFAKGTDISKGIDKVKKAKRKVVGTKRGVGGENLNDIVRGKNPRTTKDKGGKGVGAYGTGAKQVPVDVEITIPATDEAKHWDGWKTGLSPNWEPVLLGVKEGNPDLRCGSTKVAWLARKPFKGSVVRNVLAHGTGAINIEATRIGAGRWTKNVILMHTPECQISGTRKVRSGVAVRIRSGGKNIFSEVEKPTMEDMTYADADGMEETVSWQCEIGCPVTDMDLWSSTSSSVFTPPKLKRSPFASDITWETDGRALCDGISNAPINYGDIGGASRFFMQFKGLPYSLPKVLWTYLRDLITPEEGVCLISQASDLQGLDLVKMEDDSVHSMLIEGDPGDFTEDIFRVLKPGAHLIVISPDEQLTGHTVACQVEDAGFEIRDSILLLDENQSFYYAAKASSRERHSGVTEKLRKVEEEVEVEDEDGETSTVVRVKERKVCNNHPCVKPLAMFEAIMRGIPEGKLIVDPFLGSGTSAMAALKTGHNFIGIEREPEFLTIADERVRFWDSETASWNAATIESEAHPTAPEDVEVSLIEELFGV